ncbi:ATP-binding protein [Chachezhania sediminis]|uniref:ATP-binding protein n=1 Tax=Chachezhania sediminis TaxID=2599291 RepID=UPI001E2CCFC3|nr:AAA family ATPase [Chachezhania sediminis]
MAQIELNIASATLTRDGAAAALRPKTLAVLVALIERQGAVVSRDDLRRLVWGKLHGSDAGPKQCIRELRRLLEDSAPDLIETVGRQGYRLTAPIAVTGDDGALARNRTPVCPGRDPELAALAKAATRARRGARSVVLIEGEAGAGKTRLADAFLDGLGDQSLLWIARGQAIPHPGAREPYGPLLEALSQLANGGAGATLRRLLREVAPSWAEQLPGPDRRDPAAIDLDQARPDPMLREFSDLMERLTQSLPGILLLEDLHWADPSTLAWLSAWGLRRGAARLLVLGTLRDDEPDPSGALTETLGHLQRQPGTQVLTLGGLDSAAVTALLADRFPGNAFPADLARDLTLRTEGHAILVDAAIGRWTARGDIARIDGGWTLAAPVADLVGAIAPGVDSFIAGEIGRLGPSERGLLEAASVAGPVFSALALADDRADVERAERQLDDLARLRRFVEPAGTSRQPDGAVATRFAFRHVLYHEALYAGIPAANRQGLHRRIGTRMERAMGPHAAGIAPVLADHFERGADWPSAARYRGLAGLRALGRGAAPEAAVQLRQAMDLHARCPDPSEDLLNAELQALLGLGSALIVSEGFTGEELKAVYHRAQGLAARGGDSDTAVPVLAGLWNYHVTRADLARAGDLARSLSDLSRGASDAAAMAALNAAGQTDFFTGDFNACLPRIETVLTILDRAPPDQAAALFGEDPGVVCRQYAACVAQILDRGAEATAHLDAGLARADALAQPFAQAQMHWAGAIVAREQGDPDRTRRRAEALIAICDAADIPFWRPAGQMLAGWARAIRGDDGGADLLARGLARYEAMKARLTLPLGLALSAEVLSRNGDQAAALTTLNRALAVIEETGERWYEAEVLRLQAGVLSQSGRAEEAGEVLARAIDLARRQGALAFERRAVAQGRGFPPVPGQAER